MPQADLRVSELRELVQLARDLSPAEGSATLGPVLESHYGPID